jgi:Fe-S cluster assembly protein SufD
MNSPATTSTSPEDAMNEVQPYLEQFERLERDAATRHPAWVFPLRKAGLARFAARGLPTLRDEDWRFTNIAPLRRLPFRPVFDPAPEGVSGSAIDRLPLATLTADRLVFVNGHYASGLSSVRGGNEGVQVVSLAAALAADSALLQKHLACYARGEDHPFTALNTAFFSDGVFILARRGQVVKDPLHLIFVSTDAEAGGTAHPRNLILAEPQSQLTVLESYLSLTDKPCVTNGVTELVVGEGAVVEHAKFQDENPRSFHLAALHAHLDAGANFLSHSLALGAALSRFHLNTTLNGQGVECVLNGLYLAKGDQLVDHHMVVDHAQPHGASHEYYNGILAGRSRGVFHGRILVRKHAQKTDAKQTNKNLVLSDEAMIDTKPQLEIYADDVKCTHGATVGQLNRESIFYLRARGIGLERARRMLVHAFAGEIIDRIRFTPLRERLSQLVWSRLEEQEEICLTT